MQRERHDQIWIVHEMSQFLTPVLTGGKIAIESLIAATSNTEDRLFLTSLAHQQPETSQHINARRITSLDNRIFNAIQCHAYEILPACRYNVTKPLSRRIMDCLCKLAEVMKDRQGVSSALEPAIQDRHSEYLDLKSAEAALAKCLQGPVVFARSRQNRLSGPHTGRKSVLSDTTKSTPPLAPSQPESSSFSALVPLRTPSTNNSTRPRRSKGSKKEARSASEELHGCVRAAVSEDRKEWSSTEIERVRGHPAATLDDDFYHSEADFSTPLPHRKRRRMEQDAQDITVDRATGMSAWSVVSSIEPTLCHRKTGKGSELEIRDGYDNGTISSQLEAGSPCDLDGSADSEFPATEMDNNAIVVQDTGSPVQVERVSYERLEDEQEIDDILLMRMLQDVAFSCYIVDSLDATKKSSSTISSTRLQQARNATLIILPIHNKPKHHWTLAVYTPLLLQLDWYDSLGSGGPHESLLQQLFQCLSRLLGTGFQATSIKVDVMTCAQQENLVDCALFVVENARAICAGQSTPISINGLSCRQKWTKRLRETDTLAANRVPPVPSITVEQDASNDDPASVMLAYFATHFNEHRRSLVEAQESLLSAEQDVMTIHASMIRSVVEAKQYRYYCTLMEPLVQELNRFKGSQLSSYLSDSAQHRLGELKEAEQSLKDAQDAFTRHEREWQKALDQWGKRKDELQRAAARCRSWDDYRLKLL